MTKDWLFGDLEDAGLVEVIYSEDDGVVTINKYPELLRQAAQKEQTMKTGYTCSSRILTATGSAWTYQTEPMTWREALAWRDEQIASSEVLEVQILSRNPHAKIARRLYEPDGKGGARLVGKSAS